ncbi:putative zinc-binding phosphatase, partial [Trypanosoma grayi]|uniref:putative zinc-binding phosphatase n=1 Tax=Trypanosoma grayi TaxID=71804 RepID=UPI0004F4157F
MSVGAPPGTLAGELNYLSIQHSANDSEAAALLHPIGDKDGECVRSDLKISNYRIAIRPIGDDDSSGSSMSGQNYEKVEFSLPLMSINSWSLPRMSLTAAQRVVLQRGRGQALTEAATPTRSGGASSSS